MPDFWRTLQYPPLKKKKKRLRNLCNIKLVKKCRFSNGDKGEQTVLCINQDVHLQLENSLMHFSFLRVQ